MKLTLKIVLLGALTSLLSASVYSEQSTNGIAVIDVQGALLSTEVAKQAIEELQGSKAWTEVAEEAQLKVTEAQEIQQKLEKEGPTMSDDDKADSQNRLRSLSQDIQFLQQKLGQMQEELRNQVVRDQAQRFSQVTSELMKAKGIKFLLRTESVLGWDQGDPSLNITPEVMKAKGIKFLLRQESVLGWDQGDPSLNLTPEVIELLNQKEE